MSARALLGWGGLLLALALASLCGLLLGSGDLTPGQAWAALGDRTDATAATVVFDLRLPRTVNALVVGAALGLAGGLTQVHTRNPLADPGLLGITAGAGLGVAVAMAVLGLTAPGAYLWFALGGAATAGAVVLLLTARVRAFEPTTTLVLTGAVLSALLGSATTALVLLFPATMKSFQYFSVGSLVDRPLSVLAATVPLLGLGLGLALLNLPAWPSLQLGDDVAAALGRPVVRDRLVGLAAVVLLASAATAVAGSVAFVGLLAPHLAHRLSGGAPVAGVLLAAPVGALLVVSADVAGRLVLPGGEVSVGIMMAVLGAPLFVVLARRIP